MDKDRKLLKEIIKGHNATICSDCIDEILIHFETKPKNRLAVSIEEYDSEIKRGKKIYKVDFWKCDFDTNKKAIKWCLDRGLEVIE